MEVSRRLILNASLNSIIEKTELEENINDAVEVISNYSAAADKTLFFMKDRPNSKWLQQDLDYKDLKNIGNYKTTRRKNKNKQVIMFKNDVEGVEFIFKRDEANIVSELIGNVRKGEEYSKDEITKAILGATSNKSINESLIGNNARSLNAFKLDKVNIIKIRFRNPIWFPIQEGNT